MGASIHPFNPANDGFSDYKSHRSATQKTQHSKLSPSQPDLFSVHFSLNGSRFDCDLSNAEIICLDLVVARLNYLKEVDAQHCDLLFSLVGISEDTFVKAIEHITEQTITILNKLLLVLGLRRISDVIIESFHQDPLTEFQEVSAEQLTFKY